MNECCKKTLEAEWKEINQWKPFLHFCPEWDFLLIDKSDGEFDACQCFPKKAVKIIADPSVPKGEAHLKDADGNIVAKIVNLGDE